MNAFGISLFVMEVTSVLRLGLTPGAKPKNRSQIL